MSILKFKSNPSLAILERGVKLKIPVVVFALNCESAHVMLAIWIDAFVELIIDADSIEDLVDEPLT